MVTPEKLLNLLYNQKLPQIYRDEDSNIGYPLKRYLQALVYGGYSGAVEDIEKILTLIDPKAIPENMFPFLCRSFGIEYYPDIDIRYQRKFLNNLGELIRRRGTFSSIHYMIRSLTGLEAELFLEGDTLNIVLLAINMEQKNNIDVSMVVIGNYIKSQIPYYITPDISFKIGTQIVQSSYYSPSAMTTLKYHQINTKGEN